MLLTKLPDFHFPIIPPSLHYLTDIKTLLFFLKASQQTSASLQCASENRAVFTWQEADSGLAVNREHEHEHEHKQTLGRNNENCLTRNQVLWSADGGGRNVSTHQSALLSSLLSSPPVSSPPLLLASLLLSFPLLALQRQRDFLYDNLTVQLLIKNKTSTFPLIQHRL